MRLENELAPKAYYGKLGWFVLSATGFYQVEPAFPRYWFGAPLFRSMKLKVAGGTFEIKVQGPLDGHIECITLNGEPYELPYIMYQDIVSCGTLEFIMK